MLLFGAFFDTVRYKMINVSIFPLCFSLSEMVRQNSYSKIVICLYVLTTCHCSPPEKRDGICLYVLTTCHFDFNYMSIHYYLSFNVLDFD
jgi:hypothetical protein